MWVAAGWLAHLAALPLSPGPPASVLRRVRVDTWAGALRHQAWDHPGYCMSVEDPFDRWVDGVPLGRWGAGVAHGKAASGGGSSTGVQPALAASRQHPTRHCPPAFPRPAAAPTTARARCARRRSWPSLRGRWRAAARCCWSWSRCGVGLGAGRRAGTACSCAERGAGGRALPAAALPSTAAALRCRRLTAANLLCPSAPGSRTWQSTLWASCLGRQRCTRASCTTCCTTRLARPRCRWAACYLPLECSARACLG